MWVCASGEQQVEEEKEEEQEECKNTKLQGGEEFIGITSSQKPDTLTSSGEGLNGWREKETKGYERSEDAKDG